MPIIRVDGVGKIKVPDEWDEAQIGAFVARYTYDAQTTDLRSVPTSIATTAHARPLAHP